MIKLNWYFRLDDLQLVGNNAWVENIEAKPKVKKEFQHLTSDASESRRRHAVYEKEVMKKRGC